MIRAEIIADYSRIDRLFAFVEQFAPQVNKAAQLAFSRQIRLPLLQALRKTPKRRYWTGEDFVSDASRRAFFAKTGGKAYVRTGRLAAGWSTNVTVNDNAVAFSVQNAVPYEKWVTGSRQVQGHIKTGWPNHADVFNVWLPRTETTILNAIDALVNQQFEK